MVKILEGLCGCSPLAHFNVRNTSDPEKVCSLAAYFLHPSNSCLHYSGTPYQLNFLFGRRNGEIEGYHDEECRSSCLSSCEQWQYAFAVSVSTAVSHSLIGTIELGTGGRHGQPRVCMEQPRLRHPRRAADQSLSPVRGYAGLAGRWWGGRARGDSRRRTPIPGRSLWATSGAPSASGWAP